MAKHAMFGWMIINQNYHSFHLFVSVFYVAIFISFVFFFFRSIGNILKFFQNVNIVETNINLFYYCLHCSDRYSHFFSSSLSLSFWVSSAYCHCLFEFVSIHLHPKKSWSRLDVRSLATLAHITNQYVWYSFHTFRHQFLYIFFYFGWIKSGGSGANIFNCKLVCCDLYSNFFCVCVFGSILLENEPKNTIVL